MQGQKDNVTIFTHVFHFLHRGWQWFSNSLSWGVPSLNYASSLKRSTFEKLLRAVKRNMLQLVQVIIFSSRLPSSSCLLPSYMHIHIIVNFIKDISLNVFPLQILYYRIISIHESQRGRKKDSYTKKLILSFMWLWYDS